MERSQTKDITHLFLRQRYLVAYHISQTNDVYPRGEFAKQMANPSDSRSSPDLEQPLAADGGIDQRRHQDSLADGRSRRDLITEDVTLNDTSFHRGQRLSAVIHMSKNRHVYETASPSIRIDTI